MVDEQEANRTFSHAMIALEGGDFAKCERMLREVIEALGKTHHVSMLAMKTLAGITSEHGRFDEALQVLLDLMDAQMSAFGINHAETSRTINSILTICKQIGQDDIANDIANMVKAASDVEKSQTTQSFRRLRGGEEDDSNNKPGFFARLFGKKKKV